MNLEATVAAKWIMTFLLDVSLSSRENGIIQWRHNYVIVTRCRASIDGTYFYNFSVTQNVSMICAENYDKLSKSVKIMVKILSVPYLFGHELKVASDHMMPRSATALVNGLASPADVTCRMYLKCVKSFIMCQHRFDVDSNFLPYPAPFVSGTISP